MKHLFLILVAILTAGCGSGRDSRAVTPVMMDTRGTYHLSSSSETVTTMGGAAASTFAPYSSGTLSLTETDFTRTVANRAEIRTNGTYQLGTSVNTILNSRQGRFSLTTTNPAATVTGSYRVTPDFTLTLFYDPVELPGHFFAARSESWIKQSDSPRE